MLTHRGVRKWYKVAKQSFLDVGANGAIPIPNKFLGVTDKTQLSNFDIHKRCALRVLSHNEEMDMLVQSNPNCRYISYENLVRDQEREFGRVFEKPEREALGSFEVVEEGKETSLTKYLSVLNQSQIEDILEIERLWKETGYQSDPATASL